MPGYADAGGRGFFRGAGRGAGVFGRGAGFRNSFYATGLPGRERGFCPPYFPVGLSAEEERQALSRQASAYEDELGRMKKRIAELESEKGEGEI
jgi:hypothetical protein